MSENSLWINLFKICILRSFNLQKQMHCQISKIHYQVGFNKTKGLSGTISEWTLQNRIESKMAFLCVKKDIFVEKLH